MRQIKEECGVLTQIRIQGQVFAWLLFSLMLLTLSTPLAAAEYAIHYDESAVAFSGQHAGNDFQGTFENWEGQINFDPDDLENSKVQVTFDLESAVTGNKMYDGTLPKTDWFNVKDYPTGEFISESFSQNEDGTYHVKGLLTLRGKTEPVDFNFTLSDLSVDPVTMAATFPVDRLKYDIGKKSDVTAEWVSKDITMNIFVLASKIQTSQ